MLEREGEGKEVEAVRLVVFGPNFPQRAVEPQLLVGEEIAQRASIGRDQRSIQDCFFHVPPDEAVVRVRHGDSLDGKLHERFARKRIRPMDRACDRGG